MASHRRHQQGRGARQSTGPRLKCHRLGQLRLVEIWCQGLEARPNIRRPRMTRLQTKKNLSPSRDLCGPYGEEMSSLRPNQQRQGRCRGRGLETRQRLECRPRNRLGPVEVRCLWLEIRQSRSLPSLALLCLKERKRSHPVDLARRSLEIWWNG